MPSAYKLLQLALAVFGAIFLLLYPLSLVWPSGWAWHSGAPYQSMYFMMIVGLYATLGVFLLNAARNPQANLSLIWFTVWSSVVHAAIMAVQSFGGGDDRALLPWPCAGHLQLEREAEEGADQHDAGQHCDALSGRCDRDGADDVCGDQEFEAEKYR